MYTVSRILVPGNTSVRFFLIIYQSQIFMQLDPYLVHLCFLVTIVYDKLQPVINHNSAPNTHSSDLFMVSDSDYLARKLVVCHCTNDVTLSLEKSDYLKLGVSIIPAYSSFFNSKYTYGGGNSQC